MSSFKLDRRHRRQLAAACAGPLLACAAFVAPAAAEPEVADVPAAAVASPRLNLSRLMSRYDAGQAQRAAGIARTAVDRSLPGEATASLGFLCGMQPNTQTSGAAGALGVDREGRFLGAQLRVGFR